MLNKYLTLVLGTILGVSAMAYSSASASALFPLSPLASSQANVASDGIVQVKNKKEWRIDHFRNRCYDSYLGCRHFRRHHHYNGSYVFLPLIIGGYDDDDVGLSSKHVRWCLKHYPRSYNPRTNLWVSFNGKKHQCDSPFY